MENLKSAAKKIQEKGQDGDTILAHINPQEAQLLKMMGGSGTINPETGLPEFKKFWKKITAKQIVAAAAIIIAVTNPELAPAIGEAMGFTGTSAAVAGNAVIGATQAAAQGKSPEDIAKAAVANVAGQVVGGAVGGEVAGAGAPQAVSGAAGSAAGAATGAALTGGDVGKAALTGGITGGATGAYRDITAPTPVTGTTSAYEKYASDIDPLLRESMSAEQVMQGAMQSPYYTQAQSNIDPAIRETMSAEEVATAPSITTTTPGVTEYPELKRAGEKLVGQLAGQYASSLYEPTPTAPSDTSRLASTGLFAPTSIVPTALTGVAPTARGKPILGGEDEESTGAWGAKTLRG